MTKKRIFPDSGRDLERRGVLCSADSRPVPQQDDRTGGRAGGRLPLQGVDISETRGLAAR